MAPSASKPPGIKTDFSRTSSPSPSMSNNVLSNGPRSSRQLLGRGQRNTSTGLRSASIIGDATAASVSEELPYVLSDEHILKKFRGSPPSLIIHLHATHFRFDQSSSFTYTSPMRIILEHIRAREIPHDLIEFMQDVPFYDGCMIVQIHDHKSSAPSQEKARANTGPGKAVPFSIHNYNSYVTPSPYVPYVQQNVGLGKKREAEREDVKLKSTEQKDKENMPAPSLPNDVKRNPIKKVYSVVLRPTPPSQTVELVQKLGELQSGGANVRKESRQDVNGPLSATIPTPTTAIPAISRDGPGAKRVKKSNLDNSFAYNFAAECSLRTTARLHLEPVHSAAASAALLEDLAHPMHSAKPPSPKTRKRTVAELAADEAAAAEQERFMLILDERLSGLARGAQRSNVADGNGQAAGAAFEPRFERFQTLETIKLQHEEKKTAEKLRKQEEERRAQQEQQIKVEAEKKLQQQQRNTAAQHIAEQRRLQAVQQQNMPGGINSIQVPHAHPQSSAIGSGGMAAQPQRFHQQQVANQTSSPIIRNGTPQSHSSPNGMANVPMQQSTSSMGGSPARPGSVVQAHQQIPTSGGHAMAAQRSQQSHAGTPRMPHSTPNIQATPLNRQMSQTPRMSQGSPLQGTMAHTPQMQQSMGHPQQMGVNNMGMNNMGMNNMSNNPQVAQAHAQQRLRMMMQQQQQMLQAQAQQAGLNGMGGMVQNPQLQASMMQQQMARQQAGQNPTQNQQAYMAAMAARSGGMSNFNNNPNMVQQQQIQMQQLRMQQIAQAQAQAQQAHAAQQQNHQPQTQGQQMIQRQILQLAGQIYTSMKQGFMAQNGGQPVTPEVDQSLKQRAHQQAQYQVAENLKRRQQQQIAAQQANMMQNGMPNGMQNGMGL